LLIFIDNLKLSKNVVIIGQKVRQIRSCIITIMLSLSLERGVGNNQSINQSINQSFICSEQHKKQVNAQ